MFSEDFRGELNLRILLSSVSKRSTIQQHQIRCFGVLRRLRLRATNSTSINKSERTSQTESRRVDYLFTSYFNFPDSPSHGISRWSGAEFQIQQVVKRVLLKLLVLLFRRVEKRFHFLFHREIELNFIFLAEFKTWVDLSISLAYILEFNAIFLKQFFEVLRKGGLVCSEIELTGHHLSELSYWCSGEDDFVL